MKQIRKGYNDFKMATLGVAFCALMPATAANAVAIAFGAGAEIPKCVLYSDEQAYVCRDDATTDIDVVSIGVDYVVTILGNGELKGFTVALGVGSGVHGDLYSKSTVALGVNAYVTRNVKALTTVVVGVGGYVGRDLEAGTTLAMGVDSYVGGNVTAGTTFALGVGGYVCKDVKVIPIDLPPDKTAALGAGAFVHGNLEATTVTMGVGAFVNKNMKAVTATLGVDAYINGSLEAVTATLGAGACVGKEGDIPPVTKTLGAGADWGLSNCPLLRPRTRCTPIIYGRENY
jgi:hypothetical protein